MSQPLPHADIEGTVTCGLCGQVSVVSGRLESDGQVNGTIEMREAVRLLRAHQRSEVCR